MIGAAWSHNDSDDTNKTTSVTTTDIWMTAMLLMLR